MASVNKVILVGNLGADPEMRMTSKGDPVCTLSVATSDRYKSRDGVPQTRTEWHRVVLFRRLAEIANQYLRKGSAAYFEGQLKTRRWTDTNGLERYTTEVEAEELKLLEKQYFQSEATVSMTPAKAKSKAINVSLRSNFDEEDSGIPF